MKFAVAFANTGPFVQPDALANLGIRAEEAGFESLWTVEHVLVPVGYTAEYPYSSDGKMPGTEENPIPDPVLPLAFLAAVTKTLRLATGVMILPQRHPAYVAKEIATLDVLSKGRAIFGVGVGWLHEEFAALGVSFDDRGSRTKESVEAIRSLWSPGAQSFEGKFFNWGPVESNPKPVQAGGVPIVVGGHTVLAAKRAARYGNGFFPARANAKQLKELLEAMHAECKRLDRDPSEIEITTALPGLDFDRIKELADMGVSRFVIGPPGKDEKSVMDGLAQFGDGIIAKFN
ncbi:MAG: putative F420-dependent oxidoreductase [Hyphomicrobiaceae bacterium]|jgi:probable F420-dependent oxidoreductase